MQLIKLIVCISALVAKQCFAGLSIKTSKLNESSLGEALIDILVSCYADRFSTVGIAGPSAGSIIERISMKETVVSTTLIDETSKVKSHDPVNPGSRYKLQVFVITTTNQKALVSTLEQVKRSKWWNHMAFVLLVDLPIAENGCSNAYEVLWEAWKMDLLNSKFMCLHQTKGRLIYTFNPYTSKAPGPWQQENTYKGMNDHVWTLFVRKYDGNESICDKLDFDKTLDLGGSEIRGTAQAMDLWFFAGAWRKPMNSERVQNVTAQLLMDSMNATWKMSLYRSKRSQPRDSEGNPIGPENEIQKGVSDIFLEIVGLRPSEKDVYTYPFYQMQLGVMTKYRGEKSQLEKLITVLDRPSRFGVLAVLMITLLFFKFCLRKPWTPAFLDLVLIICNAGLQKIPRKTAPRIYLAGLFILVVTIQGIYSGILASLLTKKVRQPSVNSLEDLARSDHKIYGQKFWLAFFHEATFEGRLVEVPSEYCERVFDDVKAACAGSKLVQISPAVIAKLHLSREPMGSICGGYLIRADWPLEERVNTILGRLAASGILDLLHARQVQNEMNILESYDLQDQEPELKVLTLEHLGFAFVILAIGLACATVTFIIEVATFGTAMAKPRKRVRRQIRLIE